MAERSMPWTTTGSGNATAYTESQTVQFFGSLFHQDQSWGVLRDYLNELTPSVSSGNIAIATGAAMIQGYWYLNDASKTITVTTPSIGTTGYRVVLRITFASDTIEAVLLSSSDGVSALPALTQNTTIWEESICSFTKTTGGVVTLTDTRQFAQYATNHVKRNGDTMTGVLNLSTANPVVRFQETDGTANNQYWDVGANGEQFLIRALNDALSSASVVLAVDRTGTTIDTVNFPNGTLQSAGNEVWDRGDLAIRRQGGNASNWATEGTTNYTPTSIHIQVGVVSSEPGDVFVTFPTAFAGTPVVQVTPVTSTASGVAVSIFSVSTTGFWITSSGSVDSFHWYATGPA